MLVFLSDLHLTDWELGGVVSDDELATYCQDELARYCNRQPVKLVLLGDVVDLLRSARWSKLWNTSRITPWKVTRAEGCNAFDSFVGSPAESCAIEIVRGIKNRYPKFSQALKNLVDAGNLKIAYVYGNHDYIAQLSKSVREILCEFLHLEHDPARPFDLVFENEEASVYATHGHSYDPVNWHRPEEGRWAMGDAVVLRVMNRFAAEACAALGLAETSDFGRQLHELDNIEPNLDVPVYVRWMTDVVLTDEQQRTIIRNTWKNVVEEFVGDAYFQSLEYDDSEHNNLRYALRSSVSDTLVALAGVVSNFLPQCTNYQRAADELVRTLDKYRVIVFGHTHSPGIVPLSHKIDDKPTYYVNVGCWRRVVTRPSTAAHPFVGTRVASIFCVDDTPNPITGRYHLVRLCHAT